MYTPERTTIDRPVPSASPASTLPTVVTLFFNRNDTRSADSPSLAGDSIFRRGKVDHEAARVAATGLD